MSTTISFGRDNLRKRGTMLAYIFANEDCGSFVYSSVTIVVLTCYKDVMEVVKEDKYDFLKTALRKANWCIFTP